MLNTETEKMLSNMEKIEAGLSKIYGYLAQKKHFRNTVKAFWDTMKREESEHAKVFHDLRKKAKEDDSFHIEFDIDLNELKLFVKKVNQLLEKIKTEDINESEAYSVGAAIEAELNEAKFLNKIRTSDESISLKIKRLANDTKKHNLMLANYARGIH